MIYIKDILSKVGHIKYEGDKEAFVNAPISLDEQNTDDHVLMWVNDKNIARLNNVEHGTIICSPLFEAYKPGCNYIVTDKPRLVFKTILDEFFVPAVEPWIAPSASIAPGVKLGTNIYIGNNVVIEKDCVIGDNTVIGHNTVILHGTVIGNKVKIGSNNTIGGIGFGYEKDLDGIYSLIPHLGNVVIHDHVEIGNNTCIDRAVLGSTTLHEHAKIDNLVHIAHSVVIGKNSLVIAHAMIGGSTVIGENVWFAPAASVLNKKTIGDDAVIGMGAVVVKDVKAATTIVGNPGKPLEK